MQCEQTNIKMPAFRVPPRVTITGAWKSDLEKITSPSKSRVAFEFTTVGFSKSVALE